MSDSDSTWPATDDFGSRFLEIDEYIGDPVNSNSDPSPSTSSLKTRTVKLPSGSDRKFRPSQRQPVHSHTELEEIRDFYPESDNTMGTKQRHRRQPRNYWDADEDEANNIGTTFPSPKLYTARQMSLHMKRAGGARVSSPPMASISQQLECLEDTKPVVAPTPEQIAARQRSIARRRESAKTKAELQKRQTVERLLKINSSSDCFRRRGGRGRGGRVVRNLLHSVSATSLLSTASNDTTDDSGIVTPVIGQPETRGDVTTTAETRTIVSDLLPGKPNINSTILPDPPATYVRFISSQRLSPMNRVCFSKDDENLQMIDAKTATESDVPVQKQLCSQGCGRARKYACSTTGLPLCSLSCYKASMAKRRSELSVHTTAVG